MKKQKTPVPTVEDIQRRMADLREGRTPEAPETLTLRAKIRDLEGQVATLEAATAQKKLTPQEMREGLDEIFRRYGVEPAEEVIRLLTSVDAEGRHMLQAHERAKIWLELLQYRMPKLRAIEHSGRVDSNMTLVIMKYSTNEVIESRPLTLADQEPIDVEITKR